MVITRAGNVSVGSTMDQECRSSFAVQGFEEHGGVCGCGHMNAAWRD